MYGHKIGHTYCNVPVIIYWCDVELINLVWTYDYVRIDLINIKLNMRSATKFLSTVGPTIMQFCHDMFFFNTWWTITGVDINWYMQGCDRRGFLYIEWVTFSVQSAQHQGSRGFWFLWCKIVHYGEFNMSRLSLVPKTFIANTPCI